MKTTLFALGLFVIGFVAGSGLAAHRAPRFDTTGLPKHNRDHCHNPGHHERCFAPSELAVVLASTSKHQ